uniref:Protein jagunal n=1 Tax=Rhabditophanes sp. KR3021 TaxID=114890 RepID=A0AC35TGR6_9BILA
MSSKGAHVKGTDGSDYKSRQQVASRYKISADYKFYLKCVFILHFAVISFMWAKVGGEILSKYFGIELETYKKLNMPAAYHWEYVWCLSFVPPVLAIFSFKKNQINLIRISYYGTFFVGILPCMIGLGEQIPEFYSYVVHSDTETPMFKGTLPMVVIWFIFFIVAVQINGIAMYCSSILLNCWRGKFNTILTTKKEKST